MSKTSDAGTLIVAACAGLHADRDLDGRIARAVFGWQVVARDWPCGYDVEGGRYRASLYQEPDADPDLVPTMPDAVYRLPMHPWPPVERRLGDRLLHPAIVMPVPAYSTDIAAAWRVVRHYTITIPLRGDPPDPALAPQVWIWFDHDQWQSSWVGPGTDVDVTVGAGTPELAICRAALAYATILELYHA
jgi:hypothetical protein